MDCEYAEWGQWSECDKACGGGIQPRTREAVRQSWYGGIKCTEEDAKEERACNEVPCPGAIYKTRIRYIDIHLHIRNIMSCLNFRV